MSDEYKTKSNQAGLPFDPYNFSEIEKIQHEIERDLNSNKIQEEVVEASLESPPVQSITYSAELAELPAEIDFKEDEFSVGNNAAFYTETIKREKPPLSERMLPYRRMIISLALVCTLGTGSLGFGLGFAIIFMQQRIGVTEQLASSNLPEVPAVPLIDSTRLMFGNDGTSPVQEGSLADIVKLVEPAVVRISTIFQTQPAIPFFGGGSSVRYRGGTGIIFEKNADHIFIVTNDHVIRGADAVQIYIIDEGPFTASLVGRNNVADLAVISIPLAEVQRAGINDIRVAVFGNSDAMQVGDVVLAIGNAMGEGNSVTSGIISAGEKEALVLGRTMRVLQTDAAINPGASGGPLVNKQGQVIGINTVSSASDHYAIEGMGFSIPSNVAKPVIEDIINAVPGPFLGILGRNVDDDTAFDLGIPPIGVFVYRVIEGTGAEQAGLRRSDVITSFNGRAVFNFEQLQAEIAMVNIGDTVEIMVMRAGREHLVLRVTLGENTMNNF